MQYPRNMKRAFEGFDIIPVDLDQGRSYPIMVCDNGISEFGEQLRELGLGQEEAAVFTSPTVGDLYFDAVKKSLLNAGFTKVARHNIPDGEGNKNWAEFTKCCEFLLEEFPESEAIPLVVNLGGGVVGDMGGFAAATYRRGVPYVQIPTTVLGCVDSAVGGKVAVNMKNAKNILGAFYQPRLVFADLSLLHSLPKRQVRSGVAEVIKYGVVCDRDLFEYLESNIEKLVALDPVVLRWVVSKCFHIKSDIVKLDEKDKLGVRNVLNYGHTFGHAIEMAAEYRFTHGEAISIGMVAAAKLAVFLGECDESVLARSKALLERAGLPTGCDDPRVTLQRVMSSMARDKKFSNGRNLFILAKAIGRSAQKTDIKKEIIEEIVSSCLK